MSQLSGTPSQDTEAGQSCAVRPGLGSRFSEATRGPLGGGCCSKDTMDETRPQMSRAARHSRVIVGVWFLAVAGAIASRRLPGGIAMWPASLVPTWFGISHLVAAVSGYQGCPELGAIPSVMLGRPVASSCEWWQRVDGWTAARKDR
jgi:hypothetical protein